MPGYRTHLGGGLVLGGAALAGLAAFDLYRTDLRTGSVLMLATVLGALFPDTDTDSKGQNLFYFALAVLDLALIIQGAYQWAAFLGFCALLPAVGRHRGWTHTWWAMLIVPAPIVLLPALFINAPVQPLMPFYAAVVLGYLSHLLLDGRFR